MSNVETERDQKWTAEDFRPYVRSALDLWKRGELFITTGLGESDPILSPDEDVPKKSVKGHSYNKLLDEIARNIAEDKSLEKKAKKSMAKQLRSFSEEWAGMIKLHTTPANVETRNTDTPADAPAETPVDVGSVDETAKHSMGEVESEVQSEFDFEAMELTPAQLKMKEEFEKKKQEVLDTLPAEVKARFGQQYFTKWGKNLLPCLVMSPYSIPPGPARDEWFRMYEKVKKQDRISAATNMVYWYGSHQDLLNAYSLVVTSKLVPYETGIKKGHDQLPKPLQKKLEGGKKVSAQENMLIEGLKEMKMDFNKDPSERRGFLDPDVIEEYQYLDEEEEVKAEEVKVEVKVPQKSKPKKTKKRKKDEDNSTPKKVKKVKKEKQEKIVNTEGGVAPKSETAVTTPKTLGIEDIGDDDLSSHNDKDDFEDADLPSESDGDDEDFEYATGINPKSSKAKKTEEKKPPKKKGAKVKTKLERKRSGAPKKVSDNEKKRKLEQQRFTSCEDKYLQIIRDWKYGLENESKGTISEIYGRLLPHVPKFSATFIEVYEMPNLMKRSKKIVDNETRVQVWRTMKEVWTSKKAEVPAGFVPQKRDEKEQPVKEEEEEVAEKVSDTKDNIEVTGGSSSSKGNSTPIEKPTPTETQGSSAPQKSPNPVVIERKKKFSLGSIMTKPKPTSASKVSNSGLGRTLSSGQLSTQNNNRPSWISKSSSIEVPSDATRSFALEFLLQAVPFIPSNDDAVNHDAISRELEASIFEWAGGEKGSSTKEWLGRYWEKIDNLVAAISGNGGSGTIAMMISQGRFRSAADVVQLSENDIACSFEGRPLEDYNWS